jgi:hypothetical protein
MPIADVVEHADVRYGLRGDRSFLRIGEMKIVEESEGGTEPAATARHPSPDGLAEP